MSLLANKERAKLFFRLWSRETRWHGVVSYLACRRICTDRLAKEPGNLGKWRCDDDDQLFMRMEPGAMEKSKGFGRVSNVATR